MQDAIGASGDKVTARSKQEIGSHIAGLLDGQTQRDLARAVHMHPSAINRVISGQRTLGMGEVVAIAQFFGVSPASIISEEECAFAMRAAVSGAPVNEAVSICTSLIDDYLLFEAAAM